MNIPQDKKLIIKFRVEPGCLGPEGQQHVEGFCAFAQKRFETVDANIVRWQIVPRLDKKLPEMEYQITNKNLDAAKAEKYLAALDKSLEELEDHLHSELATLIDEFMRN